MVATVLCGLPPRGHEMVLCGGCCWATAGRCGWLPLAAAPARCSMLVLIEMPVEPWPEVTDGGDDEDDDDDEEDDDDGTADATTAVDDTPAGWFSSAAAAAEAAEQHTLNTTFMLLVEQRPPMRRCRSSLDEVAAKTTYSISPYFYRLSKKSNTHK